jgi:hypothetical protein
VSTTSLIDRLNLNDPADLVHLTMEDLLGEAMDWAKYLEYQHWYLNVLVPKDLPPPNLPDGGRRRVFLISNPHDTIDGGQAAARRHLPARRTGQSDGDQNVQMILDGLVGRVPVFVVSGWLPRRVTDNNRSDDPSLPVEKRCVEPDSPQSAYRVWKLYHAAIRMITLQLALRGYDVVLLDFHGIHSRGEDVLLGTYFRRTVESDIDLRFADHLRGYGFQVYAVAARPEEVPPEDQHHEWDWGHTVRAMAGFAALMRETYPGITAFRFDAIQCEHAHWFRRAGLKESWEEADELATAEADFIREEMRLAA